MNQPASERKPYDWLHFVGRSGREGRRWARAYARRRPLEELSTRSLKLLRERRFDEGYRPLAELGQALQEMGDEEPSIRSVLQRWYYGVLGFYFYSLERFDEADTAMAQAHDAVAAAVGERRFLLPLANHCHEFRLHRARIARNRRRWKEMLAYVEDTRAMLEGRSPYCILPDGTPVWISDICDFYTSVASTPEEKVSVSRLLDRSLRMGDFELFVRTMLRTPGFVIPYP